VSIGEPITLLVDSTGVKAYGEGEWTARKHCYSKRRTWRKVHLALDGQTGQIRVLIELEVVRWEAIANARGSLSRATPAHFEDSALRVRNSRLPARELLA
jgi:hypothetical protein